MLQPRDVVRLAGDGGARWAVLYVCPSGRVVTIDVGDPGAWPQFQDASTLEEAIASGEATLHDPIVSPASLRIAFTEAEMEARDRRWKLIEDLVKSVPDVFDPVLRGELVRRACAGGATPPTIRKLLRWYWQRGMTKAALVGDWSKCGAKGVERDQAAVKVGRPRLIGTQTGINLNEEMRAGIRKVVWSQWRKNGKLTIAQAYQEFCRLFFFEELEDAREGRAKWRLKPEYAETGPASEDQFDYFFRRYVDGLGLRRERRGARIWDLTERGLPGTVTAETRGPGSRYMIDATILDVYIRSRINPERIVGRAVLYVVIDVWSRLIVGIYVGVENASWACAMMALANVVEDKVLFCRRHSIEIDPHEWPTSGIGERLLSDGGEVTAEVADQLAMHFNNKVETASPFRGDLKGLVENVFNVIPATLSAFVPGWICPDYRQRGAKDYRLESALDIDDVTQQVILAVIRRNNDVAVKQYDRDAGMPAATVAPFPVDLWSFGVANRSGRFVRWPEPFVRFRLMPEFDATVDQHGIRYGGVWYLSEGVIARGWLVRGRAKPFKVRISLDPRRAGTVYLHLDGAEFGFEVCTASPTRSRAITDQAREPSFWDVALEEFDRKETLADAKNRELRSGIELTAEVKMIAADALERRNAMPGLSRAEQTGGIRFNRQVERAIQQGLDSLQFAPEIPVVKIGPATPERRDDDRTDIDIDIFDIAGEPND
jgi:hypothetical protein